MKLGLPLTRSEKSLINRFHAELSSAPIKNTSNALEQIRDITKKYLEGCIKE
ncbi:hypothetical protein [Wolbachia pipientis]|uniref:hypothetical protein n=1 Tax=Wolbachia pipientis TaxID=955 RepID=UPI0025A44548|nr:hypothetical protein [Wolbachia pipientis]MDM8335105.1 hypothetical protein [Wolbachia pipientis]